MKREKERERKKAVNMLRRNGEQALEDAFNFGYSLGEIHGIRQAKGTIKRGINE